MLVGQVVNTFGALNFMNFEIENYVRYKTFQIGKILDTKKSQGIRLFFFDRELSLEFTKINFEKQIPQHLSSK